MGSFRLENIIILLPILLMSVVLHEFAHCWTTDRLGDSTPRYEGRITLNPLAHLDPFGTIMIVISALFGFGLGWGKPSPVNPNNFRNSMRDYMFTAIAGPSSNILQMFAWASLGLIVDPFAIHAADFSLLPMLFTGPWWLGLAATFCWYGVFVNGWLAVFNMLPIFPLDGHVVLLYFAPPEWRPAIAHPAWMAVFLALVLIQPLRDMILMPLLTPVHQIALLFTHFLIGWPG